MPLAVRKAHDLVFERRAVTRADPADLAVEERRLADVRPHQIVDPFGRVEQMTQRSAADRCRRSGTRTAPAGSSPRFGVEAREVDAAPVKPRRGARSSSRPQLKPKPFSDSASSRDGGSPARPDGRCSRPDVNQAVEERPRRDDEGRAGEALPGLELETADTAGAA